MKQYLLKSFLISMLSISFGSINAQPWVSPGTAPDAQLSSGYRNIWFNPTSTSYNSIMGNSNNTGLTINANTGAPDGGAIQMAGNNESSNPGIVRVISGGSSSSNVAFDVLQYNSGAYSPSFSILKNGNVGLELYTASDFIDKFTVNGNIGFKSTSAPIFRSISGRTSDGGMTINANTGAPDGAAIQLSSIWSNAGSSGLPSGVIRFISGGSSSSDEAFSFLQYNGGGYNPSLSIQKDGKVAIGDAAFHTNTTNDYKLYVQTGILTEKVKVALMNDPSNWADFVFSKDYKLKSLQEVEGYIGTHKHLPEIPSTEEVHREGLDLAQMDAKLLQKIEELTLYVIQQQKEIDALKGKLK